MDPRSRLPTLEVPALASAIGLFQFANVSEYQKLSMFYFVIITR